MAGTVELDMIPDIASKILDRWPGAALPDLPEPVLGCGYGYTCINQAIRVWAPMALRTELGLEEHAAKLEALPEIVDAATAEAAVEAIRDPLDAAGHSWHRVFSARLSATHDPGYSIQAAPDLESAVALLKELIYETNRTTHNPRA